MAVTGLAGLFANNLLPILVIAGVGYVVAAVWRLEPRSLSIVTFQAFGPALVFDLLANSAVDGREVARMAGFASAAILAPAAIAAVYARWAALDRQRAAATVLVVLLANAGNYGLSLTMLAFGEEALSHAAIYFSTSVAITYTVGVFVASLGAADTRTALRGVLRVPTVYAVALALLVRAVGYDMPAPLDRSIGLLAQAAIPAMLIVLGMQLRANGSLPQTRAVAPAVALRLVVGPAIGIGLASLFGLTGAQRQAGILETAMPTAVVSTVLAETYGLEPAFVTQCVVITTLMSPLTLTPLLAWLGA